MYYIASRKGGGGGGGERERERTSEKGVSRVNVSCVRYERTTCHGSFYPLMYCSCCSSARTVANCLASSRLPPCLLTLAPQFLHWDTFMSGAVSGVTTSTGIPISWPWYARASAWLPADAAITPFFFCSCLCERRGGKDRT